MSTNLTGGSRTASPSDIVVPFSEIADRLRASVSPDILDQILRDIIARRRREVRPGELITADFMNLILAQLESLETRVTALEAGAGGGATTSLPPVITEVRPSEVQIRHQVEVLGRNFPSSPAEGSADVGGAPVNRFISASPSRLVFEIPPTITPLPKDVNVTVRNGLLSASSRIRVIPERVIPEGAMMISDKTPELDTIVEGGLVTFVFELDSQTTIPEDYRLEVRYTDATGRASVADWSRSTNLSLLTGRPVPSPIRIEPRNPVRVNVNITVPTGANSVNLALRAVSLNNDAQLSTTSTAIAITVGAAPEHNDGRIQFVINDLGIFARARKVDIDGQQGVEVAFGDSEFVEVKATFDVGGHYTYSALVESNAAGFWAVGAPAPTNTPESAGGEQDISVNLGLRATPGPSGTHPEKRFIVIRAARTDSDATGPFESWIRFPIQGFVPQP
jgi:hypothetical protein